MAYSLPADRSTRWDLAGLTYGPGIPVRSTVYTTLLASSYGNGTVDATSAINAAIAACPVGQRVVLGAGTFLKNGIIYGKSGVTLQGSGPVYGGAPGTWLRRTNGAQAGVDAINAAEPDIVIGESRWTWGETSSDLTAAAAKGAYSVTVASGSGFAANQLVLLDERSGAQWMTDPQGHGRQVWAAPDWRTVWQKHNPRVDIIDDFGATEYPYTAGSAGEWFCRSDRPTSEIKRIASVAGNVITFTTPIHIDYRIGATYNAQLTRLAYAAVNGFGLEGVTVSGGDDACIRFVNAYDCWVKDVEVHTWRGEGIDLTWAQRCEVRRVLVRNGAYNVPGGVAYCVSLTHGTSDCLFEDSNFREANKVFVSRCAGAGSVVGYNNLDCGYIAYAPGWQEMGVGGSHMVGPHHMLFEGNYSFNGGDDHTHGNSIFHTYFRNRLSGFRAPFVDQNSVTINDRLDLPGGNGPLRCGGPSAFSYWMSYVGNVLGTPGAMTGWSYESNANADKGIWALGWENHSTIFDPDTTLASRTLRDLNYDYLTNSIRSHGIGGAVGTNPSDTALPSSLYLASKPAFFGSRTWPWIDAQGATKAYALPAQERFDAGTPFANEAPSGALSGSAGGHAAAGGDSIEIGATVYPTADTWEATITGATPGMTLALRVTASSGETVDLDVPVPASVAGGADGHAAGAGSLRVTRPLSGTAGGQAAGAAAPTVRRPLAGSAGGQAGGSGTTTTAVPQVPVAAAAGGQAGAAGALGVSVPSAANDLGRVIVLMYTVNRARVAIRPFRLVHPDGTSIAFGVAPTGWYGSGTSPTVALGGAAGGGAGAVATGMQVSVPLGGAAAGQGGAAGAGTGQDVALGGQAGGQAGAGAGAQGVTQGVGGYSDGHAGATATLAYEVPLSGTAAGHAASQVGPAPTELAPSKLRARAIWPGIEAELVEGIQATRVTPGVRHGMKDGKAYQGDDTDILFPKARDADGNAIDLTGANLFCEVQFGDLPIVTAAATFIYADGTCRARFSAAQTSAWPTSLEGKYDGRVRLANGLVRTIGRGTFWVLDPVTRVT